MFCVFFLVILNYIPSHISQFLNIKLHVNKTFHKTTCWYIFECHSSSVFAFFCYWANKQPQKTQWAFFHIFFSIQKCNKIWLHSKCSPINIFFILLYYFLYMNTKWELLENLLYLCNIYFILITMYCRDLYVEVKSFFLLLKCLQRNIGIMCA